MPRGLSAAQIESTKDRIDFERRFISHYFSTDMLQDVAVVKELIASTRAAVNPSLIKWIQSSKTPHEIFSGHCFTGGVPLNPREDVFSLVAELWAECMRLLADKAKLDKRKHRKAAIQGKRCAIQAVQRNEFIVKQIKKDRRRK